MSGSTVDQGTSEPPERKARSLTAESLIALIGATVTVLTAVLGTVGITGGAVETILRNSPTATLAVLAVLAITVTLGMVAGFVTAWPRLLRGIAVTISFLGLIASAVYLVYLHAQDLRTATRPTIALGLTQSDPDRFDIAVTVSGAGLTHDERYRIEADFTSEIQGSSTEGHTQPFYVAYAGPDAKGNIAYKFSLVANAQQTLRVVRVWADVETEGRPASFPYDVCATGSTAKPGLSCAYVALP